MKDDADDIVIEDDEQEDSLIHTQYDIASYPSDLTLKGIKDMWDDEALVIPEFQRNFVWSLQQSSLLIDSFLCGLPVPPIFLYITPDNKNLVIDGQQRICSIVYFLEGYFGKEDSRRRKQVFRLSLGETNPYNDKTFNDLEDSDKRKLLHSSVLRAINIRQISPDDEGTSAYYIFERLNTGGTPLKPQEIRNCVFRGGFSSLLRQLNKNPSWRHILGKQSPDKHQKDVELILRIFALSYYFSEYDKPMKEFLNSAMRKNKSGKTQHAKEFVDSFPIVMENIVETLGHKPFHLRGPLNTSAMDSIVCTLLNNIDGIPPNLYQRFKILVDSKDFIECTTLGTTDSSTITKRFSLAKKVLIG